MLASTARRLSQAAAAQAHAPSSLQQLLRGALASSSSSSFSASTSSSTNAGVVASTSAPTTLAHSFASSAELAPRPYDVPEGHAKSDLSPHVCNIGLNRRRDLTLRADVLLFGKQASGTSLASLFKVREPKTREKRDQTSYFFFFWLCIGDGFLV